jgi:diaminopimelate epimerase
VVGADRTAVSRAPAGPDRDRGLPFYKLTGSGNDFVFFDVRAGGPALAADASAVAALCARGTGVGADGVVFLDAPEAGLARIVYLNSDGSRAALCGNATLCAARLAVHLGLFAEGETFRIRTDSGDVRACVRSVEGPLFELGAVLGLSTDLREAADHARGEERLGFAVAGVPHVVVRVADVDRVDLDRRGAELRRPTGDRTDGANVNFVSPAADGAYRMRTFERGVEGETLACGTGAVATAAVLRAWGEVGDSVRLLTRSGHPVVVTCQTAAAGPTLAGEGRLVFEGRLLDWR